MTRYKYIDFELIDPLLNFDTFFVITEGVSEFFLKFDSKDSSGTMGKFSF